MEDDMSSYSEGSVHQLADALEKAGFTPEGVTKLKQFENLPGIMDVLYGRAEIAYPEYLINCDANPYIPDGSSVEEHKKGGLWKWNPEISLYLSKKQEKGKVIGGNDLRKELANQPVLNANVLDWLLAHPGLIPEEWKSKAIFFWGTIYRNSDGHLYVRCLGWNGFRWGWHDRWLGRGFISDRPAALAI
jgi:hypothetical protein